MILLPMILCSAFFGSVVHGSSSIWFPGMPTGGNTATWNHHQSASKKVPRFLSTAHDQIYFQNVQNANPDKMIARGVQRLALQLDLALRSEPGPLQSDTVVFSPLSVASVLALVMLGAGGRTHAEMARALGVTAGLDLARDLGDMSVHMHFGRLLDELLQKPSNGTGMIDTPSGQALVGQALFIQRGLPVLHEYLRVSRLAYRSEVLPMDFTGNPRAAQHTINQWVSQRTSGKITNILPSPPGADTRLVLASALYFKGTWLLPFPEEDTRTRPFKISPTESVPVSMMVNAGEFPYAVNSDLKCTVLGLPYKFSRAEDQITMYIILPNEEGAGPTLALLRRLSEDVDALDAMLTSATPKQVILAIPRIKLDSALPLAPALKMLGVETLFSPRYANLSRVVAQDKAGAQGWGDIYVDEVQHRVTLELTEKGTEGAAATVASLSRDGSQRTFRADRPFLFLLRHHHTGLILFWGSVLKPY